ncbi:MAG: Na/Pi cotransporter family protein [Clostridia bacterium]|nr:Na/Pi cotransporter family protein [Clostridia bacterium]
MTFENWLGIAGGIALFLYGIRIMGNGIERLAGSKLKTILEKLTKNRFMGLVLGIIITGIIQSSNAVSVMTVGFVNAHLMPLSNAVGVIMGANVGTTITGQLIAFNIDAISPIIAFVGVMGMTFFKKKPWNNIFYVIAGLGMLFMGMMLMKKNMMPLKDEAWFVSLVSSLENPLLGILFGTLMTMLLQSVSASVGVLQAMAAAGAFGAHPLTIAVYLICGQNIGCTTVSVIAAMGGTKDAKRTACIHVMFNVFACVICVLLLQLFPGVIGFIERISGEGNYAQQLANANTFLKIGATLIMFPLSGLLIKLSQLIIRGDDLTGGMRLIHIPPKGFGSAAVAVSGAELECNRMFDLAATNMERVAEALKTRKKGDLEQIDTDEETIDFLNHEIAKALVDINRAGLGEPEARAIDRMHHVITDYERIGDHAENIAGYVAHMRENKLSLSEAAMAELDNLFGKVITIMRNAHSYMMDPTSIDYAEIEREEQEIDDLVDEYKNAHISRMEKKQCSADIGMLYVEMLTDLERVGDHAMNIAETRAPK